MNGMPDMLKGSYYANPIVDCPQVSAACKAGHHEIQHRGLGPLWALEQVNHQSPVLQCRMPQSMKLTETLKMRFSCTFSDSNQQHQLHVGINLYD